MLRRPGFSLRKTGRRQRGFPAPICPVGFCSSRKRGPERPLAFQGGGVNAGEFRPELCRAETLGHATSQNQTPRIEFRPCVSADPLRDANLRELGPAAKSGSATAKALWNSALWRFAVVDGSRACNDQRCRRIRVVPTRAVLSRAMRCLGLEILSVTRPRKLRQPTNTVHAPLPVASARSRGAGSTP